MTSKYQPSFDFSKLHWRTFTFSKVTLGYFPSRARGSMDGMSSGQITELTVFHLKAGLHLRDVTRNRADAAVQAFLRLTTTIKTQNGFLQQFWVGMLLKKLIGIN